MGETLTTGVQSDRRHGVHVRLGDVLDNHRNVIVPASDGFIIRSGDKSSVLIHERDGVYRAKMLIVSLHNLTLSQVILKKLLGGDLPLQQTDTYLDNFLILHTGQENILLISIRIKFDDIRDLAIRERLDTLARLCIPQLDVLIIGC